MGANLGGIDLLHDAKVVDEILRSGPLEARLMRSGCLLSQCGARVPCRCVAAAAADHPFDACGS